MTKDLSEIVATLDALENIHESRCASMDDHRPFPCDCGVPDFLFKLRAILSASSQERVRLETIEECARVCEQESTGEGITGTYQASWGNHLAEAIRSLPPPPMPLETEEK